MILKLSTNEYIVFVMLFNALSALFCTHVVYVCSEVENGKNFNVYNWNSCDVHGLEWKTLVSKRWEKWMVSSRIKTTSLQISLD